MKGHLALAALLAVLTTSVEASSIGGVSRVPGFYALDLDGDAPVSSTKPEDSQRGATPEDLAVAFLMLSAFLALIAGNLVRWSDEPGKVEKIR
jgi:hypothetical protein